MSSRPRPEDFVEATELVQAAEADLGRALTRIATAWQAGDAAARVRQVAAARAAVRAAIGTLEDAERVLRTMGEG